jgi:hypothetical protein
MKYVEKSAFFAPQIGLLTFSLIAMGYSAEEKGRRGDFGR